MTWRKCVRNIFSIPYNTHCNLVQSIEQDSSVIVKFHKMYLKIVNSICKQQPLRVHDVTNCHEGQWVSSIHVNFQCSVYDL